MCSAEVALGFKWADDAVSPSAHTEPWLGLLRACPSKFLLKVAKRANFLDGRTTSCTRDMSALLVCSKELMLVDHIL